MCSVSATVRVTKFISTASYQTGVKTSFLQFCPSIYLISLPSPSTHSLAHSLSLSHSLTLSLTLSLSLTHPLSLSHPHTHSLSLTYPPFIHSLSLSPTHTLTLTHSPTHPHTHSLSLSHSLTHPLTLSLSPSSVQHLKELIGRQTRLDPRHMELFYENLPYPDSPGPIPGDHLPQTTVR